MAKLKLRDIRQGKTIYHAFAFPRLNDDEPTVAWYDTVNVLGRPRPFYSPHHTGPLWGFDCTEGGFNNLRERVVWVESLLSAEALAVSFHRMFKTAAQAQRYCDRIERGCFTALERERLEKFEEEIAQEKWKEAQARAYATY